MKLRIQHIRPRIWLAIATLAVWGVSLTFGFVWDDFPMIVQNSSLHHWGTFLSGWYNDFWMLHDSPQVSGYWRPIPTMVHLLLTKFTGGAAWIFHLVNIFLHFSVTFLFYKFLVQTKLVKWFWISVLFFLWHPIVAETVSFNSAIPDLLSAFFGWWAVVLWMDQNKNQKSKLFGAMVCLTLSFLSKESGVFFGFFIVGIELLLNHKENQRSSRKNFVLIGFLMAIYIVAHILITKSIGAREMWGGDLATHIATVFKLFAQQLFLLFVPLGSSPTRDFPLGEWNQWQVWLGLVLFAGFVSTFFLSLKKNRSLAFGIFFYLVFWFPVSNIIPAEGLIADRYLYITSMTAALAVGALFARFDHFPKIVSCGLVAWGLFAINQSLVWKDSQTLWKHAVEQSPKSSVAWNEWGNVLSSQQKYADALAAYERAVQLRYNYQDASFNRVLTLFLMNDIETLESIEEHLQAFPNDPQAFDLLGSIYESQSDFLKAEEFSQKAVILAPKQWKYHFNLASVYIHMRNYDDAVAALEVAHQLAPDRYEVIKNLAASYCLDAKYMKCLTTYQELVKKFPESSEEVRVPIEQTKQLLELTQGS
jgi:tetratricopeptide (TPR) repeat protein